MEQDRTFTAFAGTRLIARGSLAETALGIKSRLDAGEIDRVLIFEDQTGRELDLDLRGTDEEIVARLADHPLAPGRAAETRPRSGPGRPRLGVVSREVSLLPRHWDWLGAQRGGASANLRRLVDEARKRDRGPQRARQAIEAAGKFMWVMAGDLPGFEEASRALYAGDLDRVGELAAEWPHDVREHLAHLVSVAAEFTD